MRRDFGLETLLDLNGQIIDQGGGYWIKIDAWAVEPSVSIPHGIRYSLSLHEPSGLRVLGYDNAHQIRPPGKFKFAGKRRAFDHVHQPGREEAQHYEFQTAAQLLSDFFKDADKILARLRAS